MEVITIIVAIVITFIITICILAAGQAMINASRQQETFRN